MILRRLELAIGHAAYVALEDLSPGLTVLHGPNEAGKSTLLALLRWLFFGPGRPPGPWESSPLRAWAEVEDSQGSRFRLERAVTARRVRGEARAFRLPDGSPVAPQDLVGGVSYDLFRKVFAIDLQEVEEIKGLAGPEVGGALLSAGSVGAGDLVQREKELERAQQRLWGPRSGELREALARWREVERALAEARREEEALARELEERDRRQKAYQQARTEAEQLEQAMRREQRLVQAAAPALELGRVRARLAQLPRRAPAPPDASERLRQLAHLRQELAQQARPAEPLGPSPVPMAEDRYLDAVLLARLVDHLPSYERTLEQSLAFERQRARALGYMEELSRQWAELVGQHPPAQTRWVPLELPPEDRRWQELAQARDQLRTAQAQREAQGPFASGEEVEASHPLAATPPEEALRRLEALRRDLARLAELEAIRPPARGKSWWWIAAALLAASAAGATVLMSSRWPGAVLAVLAAVMAVLGSLARSGPFPDDEAERAQLARQVAQASAQLGGPPRPGALDLLEMERRVQAYARFERQRQLEQQVAQAQGRWEQALERAGLPPTLPPSQLEQARALATSWRRWAEDFAQLGQEQEEAQRSLVAYAADAARLAGLGPEGLPLEQVPSLVRYLANAYARAQEERERARLEEEARSLAQPLVAWAGTDDPARLEAMLAEEEERRTLERRERELQEQISLLALGEPLEVFQRDAWERATWSPEERRARLDRMAEELHRARQRAEDEALALRRAQERAEAVAGSSLVSQLSHQLAQVEDEVASLTQAWAELTVARWLLGAARRRYQEERQPQALATASGLLRAFTLGRYRLVVAEGEEEVAFAAVDRQGRRFPAPSLSRGTRGQMYLALRLALAADYARRAEPLPVILDDVLVTFDDRRQEAALAALADFARQGPQVLLLTCHRRPREVAEELGLPVRELNLPLGALLFGGGEVEALHHPFQLGRSHPAIVLPQDTPP